MRIILFMFLFILNSVGFARNVTFSWDASTCGDCLVGGYKFYIGNVSNIYNPPIDVGNVLEYTASNLLDDQQYYASVTAYDSTRTLESNHSNEVFLEKNSTIPPPNNPPVITSIPITNATVGTLYSYQIIANDPDIGDILTYSIPSTTAIGLSINSSSGLISWIPNNIGIFSVLSRVTDNNNASATQTFNINVVEQPKLCLLCSLWDNTATPSTNWFIANPSELGLKFKSSVSGKITGLRFYKSSSDKLTKHTGTLWNNSGNKLSTLTFNNETSSGWQIAYFSNYISIQPNTEYVVSYHTSYGYALTSNYFASGPYKNNYLTAISGMYKRQTKIMFPSTIQTTNYYIDVIFSPD